MFLIIKIKFVKKVKLEVKIMDLTCSFPQNYIFFNKNNENSAQKWPVSFNVNDYKSNYC